MVWNLIVAEIAGAVIFDSAFARSLGGNLPIVTATERSSERHWLLVVNTWRLANTTIYCVEAVLLL